MCFRYPRSITEELQTLSETSMATEVAARELGALDVALQSSKVGFHEFLRFFIIMLPLVNLCIAILSVMMMLPIV